MMDFLFTMIMTLSSSSYQQFQSTLSGIGILLLLIQLEINLITNFMSFLEASESLDDIFGSVFGFYILVLGACETAIGLSLLVSYYRLSSHLNLSL